MVYPLKNQNQVGIKMSSAGLIYLHFGSEIIKNCVTSIISDMDSENIIESIQHIYKSMLNDKEKLDSLIEEVNDRIYYQFIRCVDAIDNGVNMVNLTKDQSYCFENITGLENRVNRLNPYWT